MGDGIGERDGNNVGDPGDVVHERDRVIAGERRKHGWKGVRILGDF